MITDTQYEFFKWSVCKSKDENNPDILKFKLTGDIFETQYSSCIRVMHEAKEMLLPLQYRTLLKLIQEALKKGSLFVGKDFKITTYLGISKFDKTRTPRRFRLET